ncbi:interferon regulatory factor 9 [Hoplias malabaricus]|uniref:interferon regulatory factor 9 n=1 Tax=Hoplias malabaricus TaxID=27720 RepID=UPI0034618289
MASLSAQFEDLRKKVQSCLVKTGSPQEAKDFILAMAETAMPLSNRYQHIHVEKIISENIRGNNQQETLESLKLVIKALNILEKYACNLMNPNRPKYWRTVKFNNPVFKASVDTLKGGRRILMQYGYMHQLNDGLSFPENVTTPDNHTVSVVATEVMTLRMELDLLSKGTHMHPEFFKKTIPSLQIEKQEKEIEPDAVVIKPVPKPRTNLRAMNPSSPTVKSTNPPKAAMCNICGGVPCVLCQPCGSLPFCEKCDRMIHLHPNKTEHTRDPIQTAQQEMCVICGMFPVIAHCVICAQRLCAECDKLYHSHPDRAGHRRENLKTTTALSEEHYLTPAETAGLYQSIQHSTVTEWECSSCTMVNAGSSVLCEACDRPRLAKQAELQPRKWECQKCTFINVNAVLKCEMCDMPQDETNVLVERNTISVIKNTAPLHDVTVNEPQTNFQLLDIQKQTRMREEGLELLHQLKEGEKRGVSPEEVYAAIQLSGGSNPFDWLQSELPHLLDEICALAASVQPDYETDGQIMLSRAEAKQAWLSSGGHTEKAITHLLKIREGQLGVLRSLGFADKLASEALFNSGGDLESALSSLQRPLLQHFLENIWKDQPQIYFNINDPDKEKLCRRLLGLCNLPSWGRSHLALTLLQEPNVEYTLEDVIQAVKEHHDRDFINRILNIECQICYGSFPQRKMQALTSCQCSMCSECFQMHFTVALKDKHIRDMVCPVCEEPDINDPESLVIYFSNLDVQLRVCLEPEVHELFGKKLMEHTLMKDPKFLWCCHCTNGFINEKDDFKTTCPSCFQSFCSKCKKPWEDQHLGLSCNDFHTWKRENNPEYQKQGLAGFLRENGIKCPSCKFQYALAKGGCMHFTCNQCRYEFCCGCNNPFHKKVCTQAQCTVTGLHAHHPRDCFFYLRDWEPAKLQALLQRNEVEFNTDPPEGTESAECNVMEQKDGSQVFDAPCGIETQEGHAGLCVKHYIEYLVSLINAHSLDPALQMDYEELINTCKRYHVFSDKEEEEDRDVYNARLLQKLMDVPLGDKVPRMVSGKIRSTRRLRSWIVEQVSSGKFNGLVWDNPEKTMFRIPWKHAGKQDFRSDEDAAIFKAWAEFKGKLSKPNESDPACWKTRLRCALNKSPEFREVTERSQLDISEPYKVYQLVPLSEQGVVQVKIEKGEKDVRRSKRRQRTETESSDEIHPKKMIKEEDTAAQQISMDMEASNAKEFTLHLEELTEPAVVPENGNMVNEIQLNVMIETVPQCEDKNVSPSFLVSVFYVGEEVLRRDVLGDDVRIAFVPPSPSPPSLSGCSFPRIPLPPPSADCSSAQAISDLLPFMEKGVVLTCSGRGVYAKRFCQGRVFWRGPQRTGQKLERTQPTMIFNKEQFRQELDLFRSGGCQPESEITLCFGEELSDEDNLAEKFIIIKISLPWANKEIQEADSFRNSLSILQSLAQQSSSGEVTLNLVSLPEQPVTS